MAGKYIPKGTKVPAKTPTTTSMYADSQTNMLSGIGHSASKEA